MAKSVGLRFDRSACAAGLDATACGTCEGWMECEAALKGSNSSFTPGDMFVDVVVVGGGEFTACSSSCLSSKAGDGDLLGAIGGCRV